MVQEREKPTLVVVTLDDTDKTTKTTTETEQNQPNSLPNPQEVAEKLEKGFPPLLPRKGRCGGCDVRMNMGDHMAIGGRRTPRP